MSWNNITEAGSVTNPLAITTTPYSIERCTFGRHTHRLVVQRKVWFLVWHEEYLVSRNSFGIYDYYRVPTGHRPASYTFINELDEIMEEHLLCEASSPTTSK